MPLLTFLTLFTLASKHNLSKCKQQLYECYLFICRPFNVSKIKLKNEVNIKLVCLYKTGVQLLYHQSGFIVSPLWTVFCNHNWVFPQQFSWRGYIPGILLISVVSYQKISFFNSFPQQYKKNVNLEDIILSFLKLIKQLLCEQYVATFIAATKIFLET